MCQTVASVQADLQAKAAMQDKCPTRPQQTCVFIEVNDLAHIEIRLQGEKPGMLRRTTFCGMADTGYFVPAATSPSLRSTSRKPGSDPRRSAPRRQVQCGRSADETRVRRR
jgi:hypothetical protein